MCGIVGFIDRSTPADADSILSTMLSRISHRGPDGEGRWIHQSSDQWTIALGHRRLSIIDLETGAQPLGNEDGSIQITFNGEIYNFQDLRTQLLSNGHQFKTKSDTEVIVHHYEEKNISGLTDLNGMFSFGLWDGNKNQLVLARDRAGIKPLYYALPPSGGIVFASELTGVLAHPKITRTLNWDAIASYFFSDSIPAPQTAIAGIQKLEPGRSLTFRLNECSPKIEKFWRLETKTSDPSKTNESELSEELWARLRTSVKRQMLADVPVGAFLSGGIDSSIVATLARELAGEQLQTFSIAFEDEDFDEGPYARLMAKKLGTHHIEKILSEKILLETVDASFSALDEPLADPSITPTYLLSQIAAKHVKVALGGDGGDELWAGYPTYKAHAYHHYYEALPSIFRKNIIEPLVSKLPVKATYQSLEWQLKRFTLRADADPMRRHLRWMSNSDISSLHEALPGWSETDPYLLRNPVAVGNDSHNQNQFLALDFQTYLPNSVLTKVDRASMASGLEVRPPFLDNELIDWSFSIPFSYKLHGKTSKYLLKKAAKTRLPDEIIYRPKKGFAVPIARWLRGPLLPKLKAALDHSTLWESSMISRETFVRWTELHLNQKGDFSKPLWALLVLVHWIKKENIYVKD